jgi:CheY-like chemotaxis protein
LDSISSSSAAPSILVVEDDAQAREAITRVLTQAGYEAVPATSGEDALDLIAAAEFDGLYCAIELPGRADGWEVGATFSFIWPDRPVVYASAISVPPGPLRKGVFLRKPFMVAMLARTFGPARRKGAACAGSAAQTKSGNLTAARIKPGSSFVHLS